MIIGNLSKGESAELSRHKAEFKAHVENDLRHLTQEEQNILQNFPQDFNAALADKVDITSFNSHVLDDLRHKTEAEQSKINNLPDNTLTELSKRFLNPSNLASAIKGKQYAIKLSEGGTVVLEEITASSSGGDVICDGMDESFAYDVFRNLWHLYDLMSYENYDGGYFFMPEYGADLDGLTFDDVDEGSVECESFGDESLPPSIDGGDFFPEIITHYIDGGDFFSTEITSVIDCGGY